MRGTLLHVSALCSILALGQSSKCDTILCAKGHVCKEIEGVACEKGDIDCFDFRCEPVAELLEDCGGEFCREGETCGTESFLCIPEQECRPNRPACMPIEEALCGDAICNFPTYCINDSPPCLGSRELCPVRLVCHDPTIKEEVDPCLGKCAKDEICTKQKVECTGLCPTIYSCQKMEEERCGDEVCTGDDVCLKSDEHCVNPHRCVPTIVCGTRECCNQMPTCKEGYEESNLCTDSDYESGECIWARQCCGARNCKRIPSVSPSIPSKIYKKACSIEQQVDFCVAKEMGWTIDSDCDDNCKLSVGICSSTHAYCGNLACVDGGEFTKYSCALASDSRGLRPSDPCVLGPCADGELCQSTKDTYEVSCTKKYLLGSCCESIPTCHSTERMRSTPCSFSEFSEGRCRREYKCCSEIFCLREVTTAPVPVDACASKPCPPEFVCSSDPGDGQSSFTCTKRPAFCCGDIPTCPEGYVASHKDCLYGEIGCHREARCCDEVFCRTQTPSRMTLSADCAVRPCESGTFCIEVFDDSKFACVDSFLTCGSIRCAAFEVQCPTGMEATEASCTVAEFEMGTCVRLSNPQCCQEKFCKVITIEERAKSCWEFVAIGVSLGVILVSFLGLVAWKVCCSGPLPEPTVETVGYPQKGVGEPADFIFPEVPEKV